MNNYKKNIKVCFIAPKAYQLFNPSIKSTFGGAEVQLYILAKEMAKETKLDISFIVGDYGQPETEKIEGISFYKFLNPSEKDNFVKKILHAFKLWRLLGKAKADVYLTTTSNSVTALVSTFCKFNKAIHIHRTSSDEGVNLGFVRKNGLMGKLYKFGLENSDLVITQNEEHKKMLFENHGIEAVVVKNSIEEKSDNRIGKEFVLWISRCHPLKNPELFLDLAREFEDEKFVMICPPASEHKAYHKKTKKDAKKINNVEFIDFVPYEKIQKYYDRAKVFICTSDYEGFPNTLIDSGIGRTPFVSLNVNPDEVLTRFNCGYYAERSREKLKDGLRTLLNNKEQRRVLGENIHKYTVENHSVKGNVKKLKQLIFKNVKKSN